MMPSGSEATIEFMNSPRKRASRILVLNPNMVRNAVIAVQDFINPTALVRRNPPLHLERRRVCALAERLSTIACNAPSRPPQLHTEAQEYMRADTAVRALGPLRLALTRCSSDGKQCS